MPILSQLAVAAADALNTYGYADPRAKQAVKAWQQVHGGLKLDGVYGPDSAKALAMDLPTNTVAPKAYVTAPGGDPARARLSQIASKNNLSIKSAPAGTAAAQGFRGLRDSVLGPFSDWNTQFEGALNFMYTDNIGKVTTGIGNLIDPVSTAYRLPWRRPDGSLASQAEVNAAWSTVKGAFPAVQSVNSKSLTNLRLDKDGVAQAVDTTLKANDAMLAGWYPGYPNWTADAQLAAHSMGWAMGLGHLAPHTGDFHSWILAMSQTPPDYRAAAQASHINDTTNPGLVPRNAANKILFENAARVLETNGDPEVLYYLDPLPEA